MNCPECGNPIQSDAPFCQKCLARLNPPGLWQKLLSIFRSPARPRRPAISIRKTVTIKTTDATGQKHEYHSLAEVPAELRTEIEKLQNEAMEKTVTLSASEGATDRIVTQKKVTVYKFKDASGTERVYHSLEELPPELRAAIEKANEEKKG